MAIGDQNVQIAGSVHGSLTVGHGAPPPASGLLVLDNIDSPEQLLDCLPQAGNGRVLLTSRNRLEPLLADQERIFGTEHPDALSTRNRPATAYCDAGRTWDAIAIFEPLLADREL